LKQALFFEAAGAVSKIGLSLKSNHHWQIWLAKIGEAHCKSFTDLGQGSETITFESNLTTFEASFIF
jgi:hypothetical protein